MNPVGAEKFLAPTAENPCPGDKKFPAPIGEAVPEFAYSLLEPQRKLTPAGAEAAGHSKKVPAKIPADRDFAHQARCTPSQRSPD